ncbi:centrosomal protein 43 isoform X1 [Brachyistius frenatus]|uniref:centrosomal protein 43 isoform X1 n=1 Tax=Brachyistius frenatus TaxID=100188 RepID=UPI0037E8D6B6
MSAAEDDTELRDLLIQNLENSGVFNKLKAEMRAAVFLAMEEQDKLENKSSLVNEPLKKCLNTRDGRLVASLIVDFLQVFNLDFSLAVFQPEINSLNGLDSRDLVCKELGLSESDLNRNCPVLLELVRRGRHRDRPAVPGEGDRSGNVPKEVSQKQIALARKTFDSYDKDRSGSVPKEDLTSVFADLFPGLNKNMLERFLADELRAADRSFSGTVDLQFFLAAFRRLFTQCRSVVVPDSDVGQPRGRSPAERVSKIPRYRSQNHRGQSQTAAKDLERLGSPVKGDFQQQVSSPGPRRERPDLDLEEEEEEEEEQGGGGGPDDGDSFFDDPLPKPQKTYGCQSSPFGEKDSSERTKEEDSLSGPPVSPMRRGHSLSDLSLLAADSEGERDDPLSELRKEEMSGDRGSPAGSLSEAPRPAAAGGGGGGGRSSTSEPNHSRNGASNSRERGFRAPGERAGSLHLDDDVDYDDDFNSHRSDLSRSELSIGEEIEEVSIEGPDCSDKFEETTQDLSVSQLSQSHGADYMEDVP